jgi:hypothetical protein
MKDDTQPTPQDNPPAAGTRRVVHILREEAPEPDEVPPCCELERQLCTFLLTVARSMARRGSTRAVAFATLMDGLPCSIELHFGPRAVPPGKEAAQ